MARKTRRLRMGLPKRSLTARDPMEDLALGVGLTGVYAALAIAVPLALPRLTPVISLYASGVALLYSWWLYKYHRRSGARWARIASLILLIVVAGKPLAAYAGVPGFYQSLLDGLLLLTAAITLHQASKDPGLPPQLAMQLDRLGGLAFLATFALLIPLDLVAAAALILAAASLLKGYTLLSAIARAVKTRST